jgi:hypothetical protein
MDTPEQDIDSTIAEVVRDLPKPVQDFLLGPARNETILRLSKRYRLHIDQTDEFGKAFMFMLMGVSSPEEFTVSLRTIGLSAQDITSLTRDLDAEVFTPLHNAEIGFDANPVSDFSAPPIQNYVAPVARPEPVAAIPMPAIEAQPMEMPRTMQGDMAAYQQGGAAHTYYAAPNAPHQPGWQPAASVHVFVPNGQQMGPIHAGMSPAGQGYPNMPAVPAYEAAFQPNVPQYQVPVAQQPVPVSTAPRTPWTQPAAPRVVPSANTVVPPGPPPPTHLPGTDPYREPVE